jgi:DTW domain-containing protein YfiP
MRSYEKKLSIHSDQCEHCGLDKTMCLCIYEIELTSGVEFWLLTHFNELKRTNNTGRLIENAIHTTKVFSWERTSYPEELIKLIESNIYDVYLVFSTERYEEEKRQVSYKKSNRKSVFLIIDGTWKEARKIIRKSPYLNKLPIVSFENLEKTDYTLRRNKDEDHLCTAEIACECFKLVDEKDNAEALKKYFDYFINAYNYGRYNHGKNEKTI